MEFLFIVFVFDIYDWTVTRSRLDEEVSLNPRIIISALMVVDVSITGKRLNFCFRELTTWLKLEIVSKFFRRQFKCNSVTGIPHIIYIKQMFSGNFLNPANCSFRMVQIGSVTEFSCSLVFAFILSCGLRIYVQKLLKMTNYFFSSFLLKWISFQLKWLVSDQLD